MEYNKRSGCGVGLLKKAFLMISLSNGFSVGAKLFDDGEEGKYSGVGLEE